MRDHVASVRVRLVAGTVLVITVALALGGWALTRAVETAQESRLRAVVERRLDLVASRLEAGDDRREALAAAGPVAMVQLVDPRTGNVLVVARPGVQTAGGIPFEDRIPPPGEQVAAHIKEARGAGLETITRTIRTPSGAITVVAAAPADEVARSVAAVQRALLVGLPVLLALVASAAWVVVGRALRPVEEIRREVEAISGSTLHRRVPASATGDEVARLAHTMNGMLDRLEDASNRQRAFVSDASHELRSPVATIRTELEVALSSDDGSDLRAAVERALAEEERLERLLADLLLLATAEGGGAPMEPVSLHDLARAEAARARPLPVTVAGPPAPIVVHGRRVQLERAVANLVDNAVRHARSKVEIVLFADADDAVLTVDDDGCGIPEEDRERVFDRFTRLDEGRARIDGGAGLGLALVRTIVRRHGGTVTAASSRLGGARLQIRLPRVDPA